MIDCEGVKRRVNDFDVKHGMDAVVQNGWLLFSDGAMREINPLGALIDAPANVYECAKLKVKYCETKLALATEEFNTLKHNLLMQTKAGLRERFCPAPVSVDDAISKLKEIKKKVSVCQRKLNEARTYLSKNKPASLIIREEQIEKNRKNSELFISEIERIQI